MSDTGETSSESTGDIVHCSISCRTSCRSKVDASTCMAAVSVAVVSSVADVTAQLGLRSSLVSASFRQVLSTEPWSLEPSSLESRFPLEPSWTESGSAGISWADRSSSSGCSSLRLRLVSDAEAITVRSPVFTAWLAGLVAVSSAGLLWLPRKGCVWLRSVWLKGCVWLRSVWLTISSSNGCVDVQGGVALALQPSLCCSSRLSSLSLRLTSGVEAVASAGELCAVRLPGVSSSSPSPWLTPTLLWLWWAPVLSSLGLGLGSGEGALMLASRLSSLALGLTSGEGTVVSAGELCVV